MLLDRAVNLLLVLIEMGANTCRDRSTGGNQVAVTVVNDRLVFKPRLEPVRRAAQGEAAGRGA